MQSSRTLFENGEVAVTLPTAALSGCGLARETDKSTSKYLVEVIKNDSDMDTCPEGGTCPLLKHTCVSLRVGNEKRVGGKSKTEPPKRRKQVTTSNRMQLT